MLDVETGAGAVGELVVAVDGGDVVFLHQVLHQLEKGETLWLGTGVGGVSVGIEAADIGDANAMGVVTWAMGTDLFDGTAGVDAAVRVDDIMIADVVPVEALVVAADAFDGAVGIGAGSGAVDDYFGDGAHFFVGLMGLMGVFAIFDLNSAVLKAVPCGQAGMGGGKNAAGMHGGFSLTAATVSQHTQQ